MSNDTPSSDEANRSYSHTGYYIAGAFGFLLLAPFLRYLFLRVRNSLERQTARQVAPHELGEVNIVIECNAQVDEQEPPVNTTRQPSVLTKVTEAKKAKPSVLLALSEEEAHLTVPEEEQSVKVQSSEAYVPRKVTTLSLHENSLFIQRQLDAQKKASTTLCPAQEDPKKTWMTQYPRRMKKKPLGPIRPKKSLISEHNSDEKEPNKKNINPI